MAITIQDVQNSLDDYGRAGVDGDPDLVVRLFSDTATCRETPFDDPMRERQEREYWNWKDSAVDAQEDVEFASQVWAARNDTAIAGWQARFAEKATGARVELDGTFRLVFSSEQGALQCAILEECGYSKES